MKMRSLPRVAVLVVVAAIAFAGRSARKKEKHPACAKVFGRIQYVKSFPDYKVKEVSSFPDLRVEIVDSFPNEPGKWQIVDSFPDYKIEIVDSFPDFTVQFVKSFPGPTK